MKKVLLILLLLVMCLAAAMAAKGGKGTVPAGGTGPTSGTCDEFKADFGKKYLIAKDELDGQYYLVGKESRRNRWFKITQKHCPDFPGHPQWQPVPGKKYPVLRHKIAQPEIKGGMIPALFMLFILVVGYFVLFGRRREPAV